MQATNEDPTQGEAAPPRKGLTRAQVVTVVVSCLAGCLGLLPGVAGAMDPVTLVAWLALLAAPAGFAGGAVGLRPFPYGFAAPGLWAFLVVWADMGSDRDFATPVWGALALAGLYWFFLALGSCFPGRWAAGTGTVALVVLLLTGLPVQGGLAADHAEPWGKDHPTASALLLNVFPPGVVLDCAGWTTWHTGGQLPGIYRLAGEEWHGHPRRPLDGARWGPLFVGVGLLLGEVLARWNGRRRHLL